MTTFTTKELQAAGARGQAATQGRLRHQHGDAQQQGISEQGDPIQRFASKVHLAYPKLWPVHREKSWQTQDLSEIELRVDSWFQGTS